MIFPNPILERATLGARLPSVDRPTAVFAGRLVFLKGVELAIRAVAATGDWQLVIYGSGPDERRLRKLAARLNANDRIRFAGWVSRDELLERLRAGGGRVPLPEPPR